MTTATAEALLAQITRRQLGLFTRAQALACGFSNATITRRVNGGAWERVGRGVFKLAGVPDSRDLRAMAAVLAAGPDAALSHDTAAELLGFPHFGRQEGFEVTVPARELRSVDGARLHSSESLTGEDLTTIRGLPVTSAARTICDLATRIRSDLLPDILVHAARTRRVGPREIAASLGRRRYVRGSARLSRAYEQLDDQAERVESGTEARFYLDVALRVVPRPSINAWVRIQSRRYRPDAAWLDRLLAVEVDGPHHELRSQRRKDAARDADFVNAGWHVERIPYTQLARPDLVLRRIQQVVDAHAPIADSA